MKSSIWSFSNAPFSSLCICQERPAAITNSPKSQGLHKRDDFSFMTQGMWVDGGLCSLPLGTQNSRPSGTLEFSESSGPQTRERNHMEETCFAHLPQPRGNMHYCHLEPIGENRTHLEARMLRISCAVQQGGQKHGCGGQLA